MDDIILRDNARFDAASQSAGPSEHVTAQFTSIRAGLEGWGIPSQNAGSSNLTQLVNPPLSALEGWGTS